VESSRTSFFSSSYLSQAASYYTYGERIVHLLFMNPVASESKSKRKFRDLKQSSSSDSSASPSSTPISKAQRTRESAEMSITKDDLLQLRLDLKNDLKFEIKEQMNQCIVPLVAKVSKLEFSVEVLDRKLRANNTLLHGVPNIPNESADALICYLSELWKKLGVTHQILLNDVYRLGKASTSGPRPLLVKFLRMLDKREVISKRKEAAKLKIFINGDCTALQQFEKKLLNTHLKSMKVIDGSI
jgi:uncharacterized FlaG/YvyC family protein